MKTLRLVLCVAYVAMCSLPIVLRAHELTYQGTVAALEPARLQVKVVDATSHKEQLLWFNVTKMTKIKRGAETVDYSRAGIMKDERVVVIVDHGADNKMSVTEIRLAAKK